ncbi:hypothetical protein, variant 3 [Aphanomyces invadans]|uniref:Ku domain-containing protein n=2 Tax=Aphanomyces invadans TaxID=157072 RepID=A0A024UHM4_9STRA|nr:hypothetical protein, variant 3 [Aphanomyces invadans]XP_008865487.1 hypothetical protein, variant 2 [Aphanomyces invadans]ETW05709.1 hypothetical protein, variant 2 [Aphanomyces invadans]ETW05710.1 hypothetical protein, variant 3 [Aphanomyces invadans]|eukprot:XP_008865486.1 hypothetical protein, variant 3 [Aphanomyces invadans]
MAFEWSNEEESYVPVESPGRDALIVLIDVRRSIFDLSDDPSKTWFQTCIDMLVRYLKSKVIANDNSLLGVCFFGTKQVKNINSLDHVYELQEIGYPSARRIKQLTELVSPKFNFEREFGSMASTDQVSLSNALWHCSLAFANAGLKKQDTQTIWILTNSDDPSAGNADERNRIHEQFKNQLELHRTLNLFHMPPSSTSSFDLSSFYHTMFYDASNATAPDTADGLAKQAAFAIHTYEDMMEESLRKRYRKRRLATLRFSITKTVKLSVEVYALRVRQMKPSPVHLDAETNVPLQSVTKWLCNHTGSFLTSDQINTYLPYGGHRVYLTKDDMVQIKRFDAAGVQLLGFEPTSVLRLHENVRPPYFLFPTDEDIAGSSAAFVALHRSMTTKDKVAVCRFSMRDNSPPRVAALLAQDEVNDDQGQVQPMGFQVIFLPFLDDIRPLRAPQQQATSTQVDAACQVIRSLTLSTMPSFQNPELQKHYASIQALALDEDVLAFDDKDDSTLPDAAGFARKKVVAAVEAFKEACGGDELHKESVKRKVRPDHAYVEPLRTKAYSGAVQC